MNQQTPISTPPSLLLLPMSNLRQSYRRMRAAAKPVRRLVDNPNIVSKAVPPAVQTYLPAVDPLIEALTDIDQAVSTAGATSVFGHWASRIKGQRQAADGAVAEAMAVGKSGSLSVSAYQAYAALFNSCVDAYHEVIDTRLGQQEALRLSGRRLYSADLGSWERGIVVEIVAENHEQALKLAWQALEQAKHDNRLPNDDAQMVVQMRCINLSNQAGHLVWDFFHGMYA